MAINLQDIQRWRSKKTVANSVIHVLFHLNTDEKPKPQTDDPVAPQDGQASEDNSWRRSARSNNNQQDNSKLNEMSKETFKI